MTKPPAFQLYAKDALEGTEEMSIAEFGLYFRLLFLSWGKGALPDDPARLARMAGATEAEFAACWPIVREKWDHQPGGLTNRRLEAERTKQQLFRDRQVANGQRGGRPRKPRETHTESQTEPNGNPEETHGLFLAKPSGNPEESSSLSDLRSSSSSPIFDLHTQIARARAPAPLIDGAAQRRHGTHAWCSLPERDGLCVPMFLHEEFTGKLGRATAHAELRAWYPSVVASFAGRAIGEDALDFWRNCFSTWVGAVTRPSTASGGKAADTIAAVQDMVRRRHAARAEGS